MVTIDDKTYLEVDRFSVHSCILAFTEATKSASVWEIPGKQNVIDYVRQYFVPDRLKDEFLKGLRIATITQLTKIPRVDWLPCEAGHEGYLYIMRLVLFEKGASQNPCYRILGSNEQLAQYGKFTIVSPSFQYSEIARYPVNDCANVFSKAHDEIIFGTLSTLHHVTTVNGDECYSVPDQNLNTFVDKIKTFALPYN